MFKSGDNRIEVMVKASMFSVGKILRYSRIFNCNTRRTIIIAMDHGLFMGVVRGLEKPSEVAEKVLRGGANALLVSPGIAKFIVREVGNRAGIILRIDGASTVYGSESYYTKMISSVEDALKMGADAVAVMGYVGAPKESEILGNLGAIARECEEYGILLLAEMLPVKNEKIRDPFSVEAVGSAARIGAEIGADIIKTYYTGSESSFREVVESCPIPIVVAGGPKMETKEQVLEVVRGAIKAGAAGVAFGRNIWQHEDPEDMTRKIAEIVHGEDN